MNQGTVEFVHVAPGTGGPVERRESVEAVAGRGLRGDRYFESGGTFSGGEKPRGITLFEAEVREALARDHDVHLEPGSHRRNVTTRGVALNHLVDSRFRVGEAVCAGVELCEPCDHLQGLVGIDGVLEALVHRGGLRARIVESGEIRGGDAVETRDDGTVESR